MSGFIVQNLNNNKEYRFVSMKDVLMITMTNGRIPTFYCNEGQFLLINKFEQYKDMVKILGYNFKESDRGILINCDHAKEFNEKRRIIILNKEKNIFATVSESRKPEFVSINPRKNALD